MIWCISCISSDKFPLNSTWANSLVDVHKKYLIETVWNISSRVLGHLSSGKYLLKWQRWYYDKDFQKFTSWYCGQFPMSEILKICFPQFWNFPCKLFEHVTSWHLSRISMNKILNFLRPDMIFVKKSMGGFSKITSWHVWKRSRSILRSCFLNFLKDYHGNLLNMWYPGILADFPWVIFGNFDSWSSENFPLLKYWNLIPDLLIIFYE